MTMLYLVRYCTFTSDLVAEIAESITNAGQLGSVSETIGCSFLTIVMYQHDKTIIL